MEAPGIEWNKSDFFPFYPPYQTVKTQTRFNSGEDWWYGHINHIANGQLDGYVCNGYSSFVNWFHDEQPYGCLNSNLGGDLNTTCLEEYEMGNYLWNGNDFDGTSILQALCKKDLRGNNIWYKVYNQGFFYNMRQTTDNGFIAIGLSFSTRKPFDNTIPLQYQNWNNGNPAPASIACSTLSEISGRICVVKTDADGNVLWEYLYGGIDNSHPDFLNYYSEGFDIVEYDRNGSPAYILVGWSQDGSTNSFGYRYQDGIMINIDGNGVMLEDRLILPHVSNDGYERALASVEAFYDSNTQETRIVASGRKDLDLINTYINAITIEDIANSGLSLAWDIDFANNNPNGNFTKAASYDIKFRNNIGNTILIGGIQNCDGCKYSNYDNKGDGVILEIDHSGNLLNTFSVGSVASGLVHAYDLKVGICNTEDGGFAAISSKQTQLWKDQYNGGNNITWSCSCTNCANGQFFGSTKDWWNTDAFVAKYHMNGTLEWQKQWDEDADPPQDFPGDRKKQECMYTITQADDGGLVVAGNYSSNFDDCYLVKLFSDCSQHEVYDINAPVTIITGDPTWSSNMKIKGSIVIPSDEILTIDNNAIIKFADTRAVDADGSGSPTNIVIEPGGQLILTDGAILTSLDCSGNMWDGVQVLGNPNDIQSFQTQGVISIYGSSGIENAIVAIMACEAQYDDVDGIPYPVISPSWNLGGGIVRTFPGTQFLQNRRGIHFGPYTQQSNLSFINGSLFECTGSLPGSYYNGDGTTQFISMWDVRDVDIINNTFNGHGGFNYEDRGVGITAFDANIRAFAINNQGNHFNNLYHGIDGWFTGITFSPDVITHNVFDRCWGGVYLNSAPISFIHNNRVFNIPRGDTDPGFGVWMDGSRLFEINQDNHFIGDPNWVPNHGTNYGVVATNSANWGRTIDHNIFDETVIGTQAEGDNPQLDIRCNTYTNHEAHAWAVLEKNNIGVLQDQGTGTQTQDIRPQNTFDVFANCTNAEAHFYAEYKFKYYVNNFNNGNPYHPKCSSPLLSQGTNPGTDEIINSLQNNPEDKCEVDDPCPALPCDQFRLSITNELNPQKQEGLLNELIMAYQQKDTTDNDTLLINFLLNLNTPSSQKHLVKLYSKKSDWASVQTTLANINKVSQADEDFVNYYSLVASKFSQSLQLSSSNLSDVDVSTINQIITNKTEVSSLAENLLQKAGLATFKHNIMPINKQANRENNVSTDLATIAELQIVPNPSNGHFRLQLSNVLEASTYSVSVYNAVGSKVLHHNFVSTNEELNMASAPNGIYQLVLYENGIAIGNAKIVSIK